jgi:hypothetical protein
MRAFADQPNISAYHGIHRKLYDFLSHPLAPCGTLIVLHNSVRETWDTFGHIGFYLGPAASHYRSYRCLDQETNSIRISDSIILYPAPLVEPGASRFDQLLALTENISAAADTTPTHDARAHLLEALTLLKTFLARDHETNPVPRLHQSSGPTRHRPSHGHGHHRMALQGEVTGNMHRHRPRYFPGRQQHPLAHASSLLFQTSR